MLAPGGVAVAVPDLGCDAGQLLQRPCNSGLDLEVALRDALRVVVRDLKAVEGRWKVKERQWKGQGEAVERQ